MQAARIFAAGDVRIVEEDRPLVAAEESLVRVTAVGLCGSDLHWFEEGGIGDAGLTRPLVLGHEFAGVVEGGPLDGRTVAVDPAIPCLRCVDCVQGNRNLCANVRFAGHGTNDGGLRQWVAWPTHLLYPLPEGMTAVEGALLEPLGVALHAWDLAGSAVAGTVLIVGAGPIGLCLVKIARAAGSASIIVVEPREHRREAALAAGATAAFAPDEPGLADSVAAATAQGLVDVAIEVANKAEAAPVAIGLVKNGATVVLAGIPDGDATTFQASIARRKGLTLKLSRRMGEVYPRTIELVSSGSVEVASIATHVFGLGQVADAFAAASAREGLKVVVNPQVA